VFLAVELRLPEHVAQEISLLAGGCGLVAGLLTLLSKRTANDPQDTGRARVPEEIDGGHQDAATRDRPDKGPIEEIEGDVVMKGEKLEVARGSGNVFRDLGHKNADAEQLRQSWPPRS
jgi:hypothetical protein